MTITTPRTRNCSTAVFTIVALLAAFGMSADARARAAYRPLNDVEGIDFNALLLPIAEVTADQDGSCRGLISSPLGVVRGIVQVEPGARKAWATFPSGHGIGLAEIADLQGAGPYQGRLVGVLPVSEAFRPNSLRVGIIDGVGTEAKVMMQDIHFTRSSLPERAPALLFQDGDEMLLYAFDGSTFRLIERKTIPPGTSAPTLEEVLISGYWIGADPGSASCFGAVAG